MRGILIVAIILALIIGLLPLNANAHDGFNSSARITETQSLADFVKKSDLNSSVTNVILFTVTDFASKRLPNEGQEITIDSKSFSAKDSTLSMGIIIQGQVIPIEIVMRKNISSSVAKIIINKGGSSFGGQFVSFSGLDNTNSSFTIKHTNESSEQLVVSGDKEAALRHLSSIGYRIPDLSIVFEGHRSPFE